MRELTGVIVFIDGFLSAIFGHEFLRFLNRFKGPPIYHAVLDYFLKWDERLFRIGAAGQAIVGLLIMYSNHENN